MTASPLSWSGLAGAREEVRRRWPSVYDLPVVRKRFPFLAGFLKPDSRLLEVGAAERPFEERLKESFPKVAIRTLDIDPNGRHDFHSLDEVKEVFDLVVAWEVIEHLSLDEIPGWLAGLKRVTAPGGKLVLSTPNVFRPAQYWKDATHLTPLVYTDLGALLTLAGFQVTCMHRTYHGSWLQYAMVRCSPPGLLLRLWSLDFAQSIVDVATPR